MRDDERTSILHPRGRNEDAQTSFSPAPFPRTPRRNVPPPPRILSSSSDESASPPTTMNPTAAAPTTSSAVHRAHHYGSLQCAALLQAPLSRAGGECASQATPGATNENYSLPMVPLDNPTGPFSIDPITSSEEEILTVPQKEKVSYFSRLLKRK